MKKTSRKIRFRLIAGILAGFMAVNSVAVSYAATEADTTVVAASDYAEDTNEQMLTESANVNEDSTPESTAFSETDEQTEKEMESVPFNEDEETGSGEETGSEGVFAGNESGENEEIQNPGSEDAEQDNGEDVSQEDPEGTSQGNDESTSDSSDESESQDSSEETPQYDESVLTDESREELQENSDETDPDLQEVEVSDPADSLDQLGAGTSGDTATEGTWGSGHWTITGEEGDLTLTVEGFGEIREPDEDEGGDPFPRQGVTEIIVGEGITSIGKDFFEGMEEARSVVLPESLEYIESYAFARCTNLEQVDFPSGLVRIDNHAFYMCSSLKSLIITADFVGDWAFGYCNNLQEVVLEEGIKTISESLFQGCTSLTRVYLPKSVENIEGYAFCNCNNLTDIEYAGTKAEWDKITISSSYNAPLDTVTITYAQDTDDPDLFYWGIGDDGALVISTHNQGNVSINGSFSRTDEWREQGSAPWHRHSSLITSAQVGGDADIVSPTSTGCWFDGLTMMQSCDLSGLDSSNVTNMRYMFMDCSALTELDLSNMDTRNATNMEYMFCGCDSLEELDLSSFDTRNVTAMTGMFCSDFTSDISQLRTIYVSENWNVDAVVDGDMMFNGSVNLVGGAGTVYDDNEILVTYAHIDGGVENPGYLTGKNDTPVLNMCYWGINSDHELKLSSFPLPAEYVGGSFYPSEPLDWNIPWNDQKSAITTVTVGGENDIIKPVSLAYWFSGMTNVVSIELTGLDTSRATSMNSMFSDCNKLQAIDLSGFQTENVTDMGYMFSGCYNIIELDISGLDYSKVENMERMFNCCGVSSLDFSGHTAPRVQNMNWMFNNCEYLKFVDFKNFETPQVTNISYMFADCHALRILDLDGFQTENVTNMEYMFDGCSNLPELDLSSFNTDQVQKMNRMFCGCSSLKELDLSSFDTGQALILDEMFSGCRKLETLDISSFNTRTAISMAGMFSNCEKLSALDVSGFDTSNVTDMRSMFYNCSNLQSLEVSGFHTPLVTDMSNMFQNCKSLTKLDVSGFDPLRVKSFGGMFYGCSNLVSLDLGMFKTSRAIDMGYMFSGCSSLSSLDVSSFDTSAVTGMADMFSGCASLTSLDVSSFNTVEVTTMDNMFYGCSSLTSLDVSSFNTGKVTTMNNMFFGCSNLESLDVSGFDTVEVTSMGSMFSNCSSLKRLEVGSFNTAKVTDMYGMFSNCSSLLNLDVSSFNTAKVTNMGNMFFGCSSLKSIDISSFDTAHVYDFGNVFSSCENLEDVCMRGLDLSHVYMNSDLFSQCKSIQHLVSPEMIPADQTFFLAGTFMDFSDETMYTNLPGNNRNLTKLNPGWNEIPSGWIYFDDYLIRAFECWRIMDGEPRYLNADGYIATNTFVTDSDGLYYVDSEGIRKKGWFDIEGNRYWADDNGVLAVNTTCLIDNEYYSFDEHGVLINEGLIIHVKSIILDQSNIELKQGDGVILTASVLPENAEDKSVTWISSDPGIVTADPITGIGDMCSVHAVMAGSVLITATTVDGGYTAECAVTVLPAKSGWFEEEGGWRYYAADEYVKNTWAEKDGCLRYLNSEGYMAVSDFVRDQGKLYYVDDEGIRKTGWFELEGLKYWADSDGVLAADQTVKIEDTWYTFDENGLLIKTMIGYGICGDNLTWDIVREGDKLVLEIIGYGEMYSYYESGTQPWIADSSRISALRMSDEVTVIGGNAFSCLSGLSESVILPKSLETIKVGAFIDCPCELVYEGTECDFNINVYKEDGWENGVTLTCTGGKDHTIIDEIVPGSEGGVCHHKCSRCGFGYSLEYIVDDDEGVCAISKITCEGMDRITIPAQIGEYPVISIMDNAAYMTDIRSVIIEEGVERLAYGVFAYCKKLEEVTLPESITRMDQGIFNSCEHLKSVRISSNVRQLSGIFTGCTSLEEIILPNGLEYIGPDTFRDCTALKTIHLPDSLQTIAYGAFNNCSSLTEINLPEALQTVESMAFMDCRGIKKVTVPKNCDYIQEQAFGYYYSKLYDEYRIVPGFSMRGYARSAAETYALERGIPFEVIEVPVSGIRLSDSTYALTLYYYSGGTGKLIPYIEPEEATDVTVLWSSSDESVVTVDSDGVMTAVSLGTAVITATTADGGFTAECTVTVEPEVPEFDGISIIQQDVVLEIGESSILTCEVLPPESMSMPAITWSSSDPSIVSINRDTGEITGVAPGNVTITAFSDWYGYSSECKVTVKEKAVTVTGIQLDQEILWLTEGDIFTLTATVLPENASNKSITWHTFNPAVASVDQNGTVEALSPGNTAIGAQTEDGGFFISCIVYVLEKEYPVIGITLERNSIVLLESDSFTLRATVSPDNATNKNISWQSSDTAVALVKQDGTVNGMKPGTATITATTEDGGHTAACTVTVTAEAPEIIDITMTESGVKISWEEGAGSWPYTVFRKKNSGTWEKIGETSGTSFIDEKETLRDSYVYAIRRTDEFRTDSASDRSFEVTQFRDMLDSSKYYYRHVYWAVNKGITNGYANAPDGPNKFRPEYNCTRAQMVTFLWREAGKPNPKSTKNPFKDVKSNQYYYKAVLWAAEKGITKGYSDGTFRPDDTCLREHAVTFLYRLAGKPKVKTTRNPFTDISKSDYYYTPALWASEQGIANGYTENGKKIYGPKRDCLREHIVTFLSRYDSKYGN